MSLFPKKNGGPIQKLWDAADIIQSLESVKGWLSKNAKKVSSEVKPVSKTYLTGFRVLLQHVQSDPPTAKSLAQLIAQMIQFQDTELGKGVKNPSFTRLPVSENAAASIFPI